MAEKTLEEMREAVLFARSATAGGQKFPVHVFPDAVGVDQRPVHVKQQHGPPPFLGEEPGLAISAPLC